MRLSIIIPTLNEAASLPWAIAALRRRAAREAVCEIIVADCGSLDGSLGLAVSLGASVVQDDPPLVSRAAALNKGAARASGDVLLFLDADCIVPSGYDRAMATALRDPSVVGGAFEFALDGSNVGLRLVEWINRVFQRINGYPSRGIMEASDFCRRLSREGHLALLRGRMKTSPRRFLEGGIGRVLAQDIVIWWLDLIGSSTDRFAAAYRENNVRRGRSLRCR
jgi:glycosyltransferase involved in cell wall biosynthesis